MDMDILPCAALSGQGHQHMSRNSCNTADIRPDVELPENGPPDIYLLLSKLTKFKAFVIMNIANNI